MTIAALRAKRQKALDELNAKRKKAFDAFKAHAEKKDFKKSVDQAEYDSLMKAVTDIDTEIKATEEEYDAEIKRLEDLRDLDKRELQPAGGQEHVAATAKKDADEAWTNETAAKRLGLTTNKGLMVGGICKALLVAGGSPFNALAASKSVYGDSHPVTLAIEKALVAGIGGSGGFIVPPDYVNEIIELLRPRAVVRASNPRMLPMPRGTMTLPAQTGAASASYGSEIAKINQSQQTLGEIVATYKKLTSLVPISNDLMRYANPAADAFVRDDLVKVNALAEDKAFLIGDGTQDSPKGFTAFANAYAIQQGGSAGVWSSTGNSTAASGGNFITSNETYTLTTVAQELAGLVDKLDTANVPDIRRKWFMHPRSWNYLNNVQNSLGVYVYRDELAKGTLLGYPAAKSTQIPINIHDTSSTNNDCSFVMLVEMDDALLLDSMTLELAVSREGTYYDANGTLQSAFQKDQTVIRGIAEHDFQMRHPASVAVDQFVRWASAIS